MWDKRVLEPRSLLSDFASDYFSEDDEHGTTPTGDLPEDEDSAVTITVDELMRNLAEPISDEEKLMSSETIETADVDTGPVVVLRGHAPPLLHGERTNQSTFDEINAILRARPDARNEAWDGLPAQL